MTREQAIEIITSKLGVLADERVEALAEMAQALAEPTVYSTLPDAEKVLIDQALDRLDRGEGVAWSDVKAKFDAKLKAAGV